MSNPADDDKPLDPAAARIVARVRLLMLISALTTMGAVAAVFGVIGYRVFKAEGSAPAVDVTVPLPKGARVIATAVSEGRVVVTVEIGGATEIRTFDLSTLRQTGRLRFAPEP
jgi:hypothetical protein